MPSAQANPTTRRRRAKRFPMQSRCGRWSSTATISRAADIPNAIAKLFGDEEFPGKIIQDASGKRVASSTTIFPVIVAGGRAVDALRSITVAQHLFGLKNIVVVHHSYCGATSFTDKGIIDAYRHEHDSDISGLYDKAHICIDDYEASLKRDAALIRANAGTPKHANIFGYFYDIDSGELIEVISDKVEED